MINISTRKHDDFSIEFKISYFANHKEKKNRFSVNTWIFIPNSLDINQTTYSNLQFYKDIKSSIRFITPVYRLDQLSQENSTPLMMLSTSLEQLIEKRDLPSLNNFEYNVKMFSSIFKSALRNKIISIMNIRASDIRDDVYDQLLADIEVVMNGYRSLYSIIDKDDIPEQYKYVFSFGDEFISDIVHRQLFRLLRYLQQSDPKLFYRKKESFILILDREVNYRKERGFNVIDKSDPGKNVNLISRSGYLKKYIESELFLNVDKKKDGILVEQIYYSLAAGIAMIFATVVSFSFQKRYGSFTMPLFVALVVSYMLKDRIKDLMRYYFAHKLKDKYFDNKTTITVGEHKIGTLKEGMDFIKDERVPEQVLKIRNRTPLLEANNRIFQEKIILYRKTLELNISELDHYSHYKISGINEILRFNFSNFLTKMDDPIVPLYIRSEDQELEEVAAPKIYFVDFIIQIKSDGQEAYHRFRVALNRDGIKSVTEIEL